MLKETSDGCENYSNGAKWSLRISWAEYTHKTFQGEKYKTLIFCSMSSFSPFIA